MLAQREYNQVLQKLALLREPVDTFFDDVMVMADDSAVRNNRLALLYSLQQLFIGVADISQLVPAKWSKGVGQQDVIVRKDSTII